MSCPPAPRKRPADGFSDGFRTEEETDVHRDGGNQRPGRAGPNGRRGRSAFRRICADFGAAYVVGEMVSCKGLCFGDNKSEELLILDEEERPAAVQLFGDDPGRMARAARPALEKAVPMSSTSTWAVPLPKLRGTPAAAP